MATVDERPRLVEAAFALATIAMLSVGAVACRDEAANGPGRLSVAPRDASADGDAPDAPDASDGNADAADAATTKKAVGDTCVDDDECATGACFHGNARAYCTTHCDPAKAADDCPVPPYTGVCNMQGFCKL